MKFQILTKLEQLLLDEKHSSLFKWKVQVKVQGGDNNEMFTWVTFDGWPLKWEPLQHFNLNLALNNLGKRLSSTSYFIFLCTRYSKICHPQFHIDPSKWHLEHIKIPVHESATSRWSCRQPPYRGWVINSWTESDVPQQVKLSQITELVDAMWTVLICRTWVRQKRKYKFVPDSNE